jgi:hypothetical protein
MNTKALETGTMYLVLTSLSYLNDCNLAAGVRVSDFCMESTQEAMESKDNCGNA